MTDPLESDEEAGAAIEPSDGAGSGGRPFVYPDTIYEPRAIDGAAFLFFEEALDLPLPPLIFTQEAFDLLDLVDRRSPLWAPTLHSILDTWDVEMAGWQNFEKSIEPLRDRYKTVMLAYPANEEALADVDSLIAAAGLSVADVTPIADPVCACGELVLHLFLEAWLECEQDYEKLYEYCERIFRNEDFADLLVRAYFFRTLVLARFHHFAPVILLNNPRLMPLLGDLPVEAEPRADESFDPITWELFRQILSPHLDPISYDRAEILADILTNRTDELQRYRQKCERLAEEVQAPGAPGDMTKVVRRFVRLHVADEIADLLRLNRRARDAYINSVLEDEKTWAATLAAIGALATGHLELSVGAGLGGLASLGTKALRAARERREALRTSTSASSTASVDPTDAWRDGHFPSSPIG